MGLPLEFLTDFFERRAAGLFSGSISFAVLHVARGPSAFAGSVGDFFARLGLVFAGVPSGAASALCGVSVPQLLEFRPDPGHGRERA